MVGHGGSSASSYLADPTSPIPSYCASIVATSTVPVKMLIESQYQTTCTYYQYTDMYQECCTQAQYQEAKYHTIIRAAFVCVFVCSLSPPRSFGRSSPNLVGVCRWTSHLPLRGSFSKRSTGQRVTFTFHYIIYAPASLHTTAKVPFALLLLLQSLIRRLLLHCISRGAGCM